MKVCKRISVFILIFAGILVLASFTVYRSPTVKTVVIDAGHGGKDPGCHGGTSIEKHVALGVALKLGKYIEDNFKDVKVIYTRKTDVFVELQERAAIANRARADLFISIHCNSACSRDKKTRKENCNPDANGVETYVMGLSNEQGNLNVAKRENATILLEENYQKNYEGFDPNSDEANIIFALYQNAFLQNSLSLASKMQKQYKDKAARNDRGVKRASLWVLWKTAMPSLLTEIGFLTNPEESKFLGSEEGQKYVASCIFRAFREYKNELEGKSIKYNDEVENLPPLVNKPDTSNNNPKELKSYADSALTDTTASELIGGMVNEDSLKKVREKAYAEAKADSLKKQQKIEADKKAAIAKADSLKKIQKAEADKKALIARQDSIRKQQKADLDKKMAIAKQDSLTKLKAKKAGLAEDSLKRLETLKQLVLKPDTTKQDQNFSVSFRVQIISSGKKLAANSELFKGEKVREYMAENIFKYTVGDFPDKASAAKLQGELRKKGFSDAFVVAFKDGKRIPVNDAR